MIVKLVEISESNKFSESKRLKEKYCLKEVYVNSEHVVCLREDETIKRRLDEGSLVEGLDSRQSFTKIYLDRGQSGIDLTVVGEPRAIQEKLGLHKSKKELLKG